MGIREFQKQDTEKILSVMSRAFLNDPLYAYFIKEPQTRTAFLKKFMRFRLTYGQKKGRVFVSDGCEGVLILIEPNRSMTPLDLFFDGGLSAMLSCTASQRKRIMEFNTFADRQRERYIQPPFWHVSPVCVSPETQGRGIGSALIRHGLDIVKFSGTPCYLETQSAGNLPFYEGLGFLAAGRAEVPGTDLTSFSMIFPA